MVEKEKHAAVHTALKKRLSLVAGVLLAAVAVIAVYFLLQERENEEYYIIYIPKSTVVNNDFWSAVSKGCMTAARDNNVVLDEVGPKDETEIAQQNALIHESVQKKPDAMIVAPSSATESIEALEEVKAAHIPLIYLDSVTAKDLADCEVATDNVAAGVKIAEQMKKSITASDFIGIVSHIKGSSTAQEREKGFLEGMAAYRSQIVATVYSNSLVDIGREVTKKLLTEHPEITYLACMNEDSSVGACQAVSELGLAGKVRMVGFDNSLAEIQALEDGTLEALVIQKSFTMGYFGVENAVKLIRGETVDKKTDSGSALITRDTMYEDENQELLFPFYTQE